MDKRTEELLLKSTSIIKTTDFKGRKHTATCFFVKDIIKGEEKHFLVTNKHVLQNKRKASLFLDKYDIKNKTFIFNNEIVLNLGNDIKFHPTYDIAIVDITFLRKLLIRLKKYLHIPL